MDDSLHCTHCGTSMRVPTVGSVTMCSACGQAHVLALIPFTFTVGVGRPAEATTRTDIPAIPHHEARTSPQSPPAPQAEAIADPRWPNGTPVLVTWQNTAFEGVIVGYRGSDQWEVHYPEWGEKHNEVVGLDRIGARPVFRPVAMDSAVAPGMKLQAQWRGEWYEAEVLAVQAEGLVRIHYVGFTEEWDQAVARSQLRVAVA